MNKKLLATFISVSFWGFLCLLSTGCMQITGAQRIDAWGFVIESNSGFEVSAGAMQFDGADNRKSKQAGGRSARSASTKDEAHY